MPNQKQILYQLFIFKTPKIGRNKIWTISFSFLSRKGWRKSKGLDINRKKVYQSNIAGGVGLVTLEILTDPVGQIAV